MSGDTTFECTGFYSRKFGICMSSDNAHLVEGFNTLVFDIEQAQNIGTWGILKDILSRRIDEKENGVFVFVRHCFYVSSGWYAFLKTQGCRLIWKSYCFLWDLIHILEYSFELLKKVRRGDVRENLEGCLSDARNRLLELATVPVDWGYEVMIMREEINN